MQSSGLLTEYYIPKSFQRKQSPPAPASKPAVQRQLPASERSVERTALPKYNSKEQYYQDQIEKLKTELFLKDREIEKMRPPAEKPVTSSPPPPTPGLSRETHFFINKEMYDKQQTQQKKQVAFADLNLQLTAREKVKQLELLEKETALARRLEDLQKIKQEEEIAKAQRIERIKNYKADLDVQKQLKDRYTFEEKRHSKSEIPRHTENNPHLPPVSEIPRPNNQFQQNAQTFYEFDQTPPPKYTRSPHSLVYNPITGQLRDTSMSQYGMIQREQNPFVPYFKNQNKVSSDYSTLSAFQQPRYTKKNPMVVASFPMTGVKQVNPTTISNGFKADMQNFFGV